MPTAASTTRLDLVGALGIEAGLVPAAAVGPYTGATTPVGPVTASALTLVGAGAVLLAKPARRALASSCATLEH
jgi:hypothetical protein